METEFARTFLTVVAEGNFVKAAAQLHVSQSTVSARIRALEEYLGSRLFVRNKAGTALTPAGRRFQVHASALVRTLEQARQDTGMPDGFRTTLTIGGRFGLWDQFLLRWLAWMRAHAPDVAIRAEIGVEDQLMQRLVEGTMDIGLMYTPQNRPGLTVAPLFDEELILVARAQPAGERAHDTGGPGTGAQGPRAQGLAAHDLDAHRDYVHVDWGPEFFDKHRLQFPHLHPPALVTSIGWLGLKHILGEGGTGYFPERLVREHLRAGALQRIPDAPPFMLPAYLVYPKEADADALELALSGIRSIAAALKRS